MIITLSMIVMVAGRQMFLRHFLLNDCMTVRHFGLSQQNVGFDNHFADDRGVDVRDVFRVEAEHRRAQRRRNPARPIQRFVSPNFQTRSRVRRRNRRRGATRHKDFSFDRRRHPNRRLANDLVCRRRRLGRHVRTRVRRHDDVIRLRFGVEDSDNQDIDNHEQREGNDVSEDGVGSDEVDSIVILILSQRRGRDLEVGDVALADRRRLDAFDDRLDDARRQNVGHWSGLLGQVRHQVWMDKTDVNQFDESGKLKEIH